MEIIIITTNGDVLQYEDDVIAIEYNGSTIYYTLSGGDMHEIEIKYIKKFIVI